jgi:hypothetical protein
MPRARKTQSGQTAQPMKSVPGQMYGKGKELSTLDRQMPTPNVQARTQQVVQQAARQPTQASAGAQPTVAPVDRAMAAAQQLQGRAGMLSQPTQRPMEPLSAGLPSGPGPGPEALGMPMRSPLGETLRQLSNVSGDPIFLELANRANL